MNLAVLKKSRRAPEVGDVFAMRPPDGPFLYGRVISTDADPLGVGGAILLYVYRARSGRPQDVPALRPDGLLIAPVMTNRQPWSKGYFELVRNEPLTAVDQLPRHVFRDTSGRFFDERGQRVDGPGAGELVGQWGLHSYRTIDDEISRALGIPLAPD